MTHGQMKTLQRIHGRRRVGDHAKACIEVATSWLTISLYCLDSKFGRESGYQILTYVMPQVPVIFAIVREV